MVARNSKSTLHCQWLLAIVAMLVCADLRPLSAQTEVSSGHRLTEEMRAKLLQPGNLTLRDANFAEAMFAVRKVWDVNVVVAGDLKEEQVSCEFVETPLHEILDTILTPRGYGYRLIGKSVVIVKQEALGQVKPLFESATIPVMFADPKEVMEAASFYLSEKGQMKAVDSAKRLVVIDYPERLELIRGKVKELDQAARELAGGVGPVDTPSTDERDPADINTNESGSGAVTVPVMPGYNNKAAFFDLKHTKAESVMQALLPLMSGSGKLSVLAKDNRLIAVDAPERLAVLADAVRELDVPRPQVRISALIYDAALEDVRRLGINWVGTGFHGHNLNGNGLAQDSVMLNAITAAAPAAGAANGAVAMQSLGSTFDVVAVVNALAQSKKSKLLADPSVTVYDQEEAKIDIVTEIPFQQLTQGANGSNIGTTAFREAGVSLTVTPQISDDETITMQVNPVFSLLTGFTPGTNQPIIDRRETNTMVRIRNRETLVIGGLRQKNSIGARSGIPGLMNLHWPIGELFKTKEMTAKESELVVFITPEVLDLCYLGQTREHNILNSAMPSLETIPHPELPDPPCPLEDWKHRCGCKKCKKGGHNGPCKNCPPEMPPSTTIYESPEVIPPALPEHQPYSAPQAAAPSRQVPVLPLSPAPAQLEEPKPAPSPQLEPEQPRNSSTRIPPVHVDESSSIMPVIDPPAQIVKEAPLVRRPLRLTPASATMKTQETPAVPAVIKEPVTRQRGRLSPVQVHSAANKAVRLPPIASEALPSSGIAVTQRLPALEREEPAHTAQRLTPRDIFALPPVEANKIR